MYNAGGGFQKNHATCCIIWIHCLYDLDTLVDFDRIVKSFKKSLKPCRFKIIIVNNNPVQPANCLGYKIIKGSNQKKEFSAWFEGWQHLSGESLENSLCILSNDTLNKSHVFYRYLMPLFKIAIKKYLLNKKTYKPVAVGIPERYKFLDEVPNYFTSYFVAMNASAARIVMPDIEKNCAPAYINEEFNTQFGVVSSSNSDYGKFLNHWITDKHRGWYLACSHNKTSHDFLKKKAMCILLEHSLSIRLCKSDANCYSCFGTVWFLSKILRYIYVAQEIYLAKRSRRFREVKLMIPSPT